MDSANSGSAAHMLIEKVNGHFKHGEDARYEVVALNEGRANGLSYDFTIDEVTVNQITARIFHDVQISDHGFEHVGAGQTSQPLMHQNHVLKAFH